MSLIAAKSRFCGLFAIRLEGGKVVEMINCSKEVVVKVGCEGRGSNKREEPTIYIYK